MKWNMIPLFPVVITPYELMGNIRVATTADLEGVRVRGTVPKATPLEAFGAVIMWVRGPESYGALERGMVDVGTFPLRSLDVDHYADISKYCTLGLGIGASHHTVCASKDAWDALPQNIKDVHKEVMAEYSAFCATQYVELNKQALDNFRAKGIEIIEFPAAERAKVEAEAIKVAEDYAASMEGRGIPGWTLLQWLLAKKAELLD